MDGLGPLHTRTKKCSSERSVSYLQLGVLGSSYRPGTPSTSLVRSKKEGSHRQTRSGQKFDGICVKRKDVSIEDVVTLRVRKEAGWRSAYLPDEGLVGVGTTSHQGSGIWGWGAVNETDHRVLFRLGVVETRGVSRHVPQPVDGVVAGGSRVLRLRGQGRPDGVRSHD